MTSIRFSFFFFLFFLDESVDIVDGENEDFHARIKYSCTEDLLDGDGVDSAREKDRRHKICMLSGC